LSDAVPVYLYCPAFSDSVYTGVHGDRPPSHSAHLAPSAQAELSGACGQGPGSPPTCCPSQSVISSGYLLSVISLQLSRIIEDTVAAR